MNRRYLRFGLRTLLTVVTIIALAGGWLAERRNRRQVAIRTINAAGGGLSSEHSWWRMQTAFLPPTSPRAQVRRSWREILFGEQYRGVDFTDGRPLTGQTLEAVAAISEAKLLSFHGGVLSDDHVARLAGLRQVETFIASGSPLTDRSAEVVGRWSELKWLELNDTQLTDAAVPHLIKLQKLEVLRIQGTKITDHGFAQLAALKNLKDLTIGDSPNRPMPVSVQCRDELQRALPNCRFNGTFYAGQ
jgi:hypothetical protein